MSSPEHRHSYSDGMSLPVVETFYTIQGEGFNTGLAAWFIRLAGCDVRCPWCDSKNTWSPHLFPIRTVDDLVNEVSATPAENIVLTGGEPLLHNLNPLCSALRASGYNILLETSGTHPLSGDFDWICLSPKTFRPPLPEMLAAADEIKVVVSGPDDIEWAEQCASQTKAGCLHYLQPEWDKKDVSMPILVDYVKRHPAWRISVQTHKFMNIP